MPLLIKIIVAFALSAIGVGISQIPVPAEPVNEITFIERYEAVGGFGQFMADLYRFVPPVPTTTPPAPVYKHGDCTWLPALALEAGWQPNQIEQLTEIALRESGCCPRRIGGQKVLPDCTPNGFSETNHMSDSGLLQNNGINWDLTRNPYAPICLEMGVCTQEPLLDPLTNLKAGKLLFDYWQKTAGNGWLPWDICNRTNTCQKA
ncbi:hypothetical protein UFOVP979_18 [uncultured Caudovirales phage]|uniref:Transglycosylase SLT domain 1 n=1 Tax=uncultured Caudovirales phage TaxID=2100421 RepID=A0A6J7XD15_9CAUD|nr:hypothetical protein UFOVP979_18 [uncultured Caudovirales phage]CAB4217294.1 hypothetical protein UFOVP1503_18 [uncultured Caudovirales phage]CAB5225741.1 hypothetical protein UFOVP1505_8 [uncultured Caudovirales phage]